VGLGDAFDLDGDGELGVLCVHGFTSTPFEIRPLAEALSRDGHAVHAPLLPGHGTRVEDLAGVIWRDWVDAAEAGLAKVAARSRRVAVAGQSLGGLLCLELASRHPELVAVASLAAPLWLDGLGGLAARWTGPGGWLAGKVRSLPKLGGSDIRDDDARAANPCYRSIPTGALAELVAFMAFVDDALPRVTSPVLVLHGRQDHTAPVGSAARLAARVAMRSRAVRTRIFDASYHLLAVDVERDQVAAEVTAFFGHHLRT
jgi:carboxylesterase